jgi:quinol monooxygenase YgiN
MIALIVVALGAVAAAVGTGMFAGRSTRNPRVYFVAWTVALFGLAVGLGAATLGYLAGFGALTFRAMEFGAQLIAPLSLCLASVEIVARRVGARFAMRLATGAIAAVALVVLGTDPINPNVTFSTTWPDPTIFYEVVPLTVLGFVALFTAVTAVAVLAVVRLRSSRRELPRADARSPMYLASAAFVVIVPGLVWVARKGLGVALPLPNKDVFAAFCALAVGLTWYGARLAGDRDLAAAGPEPGSRGRAPRDWDDDSSASYLRGGRPAYEGYETGEFDDVYADDSYGGQRSRPAVDQYDEPPSDVLYPGRYPGLAALAAEPAKVPDDRGTYSEHDEFPHTGQLDDRYDVGPSDPRGQLFGQITIYTLVEGGANEFDELTEWVVAQVRAAEPDALVYIVHAVPTAPMQRILYEVYRDRAAYEEHLRRRYLRTFEAEQRPFVLAANVIELGLQQAKVSPLPSFSAISDILSESGIDLTGMTRAAQPPYERQQQYEHQQQYERQPRYEPQPSYEPQPQHEPPYQGWAEIRGEDPRYL